MVAASLKVFFSLKAYSYKVLLQQPSQKLVCLKSLTNFQNLVNVNELTWCVYIVSTLFVYILITPQSGRLFVQLLKCICVSRNCLQIEGSKLQFLPHMIPLTRY